MKPSFLHLPENIINQARNAIRVIALFLAASLAVLGYLAFQAARTPSMQLWGIVIAVAVVNAFQFAGLVVARRGRHELGIWLAFLPWLLLLLTITALVSGLGFVLMAVAIAIITLISGQTLPSRQATILSIIGVVTGIIILLVDTFIPTARIAIAGFGQVAIFLVGALALIFGYTTLRQFRNYSLRTKMISSFLLVALIPLLIIAYLNYRAFSSALTQSVNEKLYSAAQLTAAELDEFMQLNIEAIRVEAQMKAVLEYLALPASQRAGSEQEQNLQTLFATLIRQNPIYNDSIAIYDTRGIVLYDTYTADIGVNKSDRLYFQDVMQTGRPLASDIEFSATTGVASIYFAAPVRDSSGEIIAVLRKRFNAAILQKYLTENNGLAGESSFPVLVDSHTYFRLAHGNDPTLDFKSIVPMDAAALAELQVARHAPPGTSEELSTNLPDLKAGLENYAKQPFFAAEFRQGDNIIEQGAVLAMKTQPWLVIFAQSQNIFLAPITTQTNTSILISLGLAFAVAAAGFSLSQILVGPIARLTQTAQAVSGGDINAQAKVETGDEIGALAGAFNAMTAQLRTFIATLEQRVADRTKALATSSAVSRRLSTILDQKELVSEVVNQVNSAFGYYHTQIYFYDEANENLVMAGGTGEAGELMLAQFHKVMKGRGLVGRAAESNEAALVSDTSKNPDWLPNVLLPDTKSEVAIPISIGERVLGVLDVQHNITDGLQQEDVDSLSSIANQVAVALQNIRQYENTQKIATDMGVVAEVGIATSNITEIESLLQEVVDLSKKSFNLYHAHIYLLNETGDFLELASGAGEVGRQMVSEQRRIPFDSEQSLVARAARTHEGVVVNDVTAAADFLPNPLLPDTRSEMAVPMIVAGKVIGVLDVQSEIANRFTDIDVSIKTTLASQVAVALQNARSFSQTQRQAQHETSVNLITQKIQSATSIESALQIAARELGHALGMKHTLVALDPEALAGEKNVGRND